MAYTSVPLKGCVIDRGEHYETDESEAVKKTAEFYKNIDLHLCDFPEMHPWFSAPEYQKVCEIPYKSPENSLWIDGIMKNAVSQHQLGCAVDFGSITDDWGDTKMGKWVYQNAADYGWSLSFPREYEDVTGYMWECWHFRYIGIPACRFQKKWFSDVQQFMLEFIDAWKKQSV